MKFLLKLSNDNVYCNSWSEVIDELSSAAAYYAFEEHSSFTVEIERLLTIPKL